MHSARIKSTKQWSFLPSSFLCKHYYSRFFTRIPEPTWSIRDLPLHRQEQEEQDSSFPSRTAAAVVQDVELDTLAKRCLIDLDHLSNHEREEFKIELGNIMKCISLVSRQDTATSHTTTTISTTTDAGSADANEQVKESSDDSVIRQILATEEEMYDLPRGFLDKNCPVRNEIAELQAWERNGVREESEYIFNHLSSKLVRVKQNKGGTYVDGDDDGDDECDVYFMLEEKEQQER